MIEGGPKEAYNTSKAPTAWASSHQKQQRKHPDGKHSFSELADWVLQWLTQLQTPSAYQTYSRVTRPQHKRLKACLCWGKRWKRLCIARKQESLRTTLPLNCLSMGARQQWQSWQWQAKKIWERLQWPKEWTQSFVIPLSKKGKLKQCQSYCTMSLISHPSKIMLWVILSWLKTKGGELWQMNKQLSDQAGAQ